MSATRAMIMQYERLGISGKVKKRWKEEEEELVEREREEEEEEEESW
jgi:hypothetical protein